MVRFTKMMNQCFDRVVCAGTLLAPLSKLRASLRTVYNIIGPSTAVIAAKKQIETQLKV